MVFLHFLCKLLPKMGKQQIATVPSEIFNLWLLTWKQQLVHLFLIIVNIVFLPVLWPIHRFPRFSETTHLMFLDVIFSATKGLYNIRGLFVIFKCPADLLGMCPRFFIDDHNTQFNCIKGKWYHGRHTYLFAILFGSKKFLYLVIR